MTRQKAICSLLAVPFTICGLLLFVYYLRFVLPAFDQFLKILTNDDPFIQLTVWLILSWYFMKGLINSEQVLNRSHNYMTNCIDWLVSQVRTR